MVDKIEYISESDVLNAGREKINKFAIDPAMRAELNSVDAKSVANQANQTSQSAEAIAINTDDRLDNIIVGEMKDAEVIDARRPFGSEAYQTLGDRLDSEKAKVTAQLEQNTQKIGSTLELGGYPRSLSTSLSERELNVKDFGAMGNANFFNPEDSKFYQDENFNILANDDTDAFRRAILFAFDKRIGKLIVPKGRFLISDTITIDKRAIVIEGLNTHDSKIVVAPNFANGIKKQPIIHYYTGNNSVAIDKVYTRMLGFDAEHDNQNTRGIKFEFLIYTSGFEYLDFEQFSGASICSDGIGKDVSEMLKLNQIRIQPRGKIRVEPEILLRRVNEVVIESNRFFAKEFGASTPTTQPLIRLIGCMGIQINGQNSFFYSDDSEPIQIISGEGDPVTQGIFIDANTFEKCGYQETITINGKGAGVSLATTDVNIGRNRYNQSTAKIKLTNVLNGQIMDLAASVELNEKTDLCTVFYNSTYGATVVDNTIDSRNTVCDVGGDYNISKFGVKSGSTKASIKSGATPALELTGNLNSRFKFEGRVDDASVNRKRAGVFIDEKEVATFTQHGFVPFLKTTAGAPTNAGGDVKQGATVLNLVDKKLYILVGQSWQSISFD